MFDKLSTIKSKPVDNLDDTPKPLRKLSTYLTSMLRFTSSFRAAKAVRSGRTLKLLGALFAFAATVTITMQPVEASTLNSDYFKLYLHSKIINYKQFQCAVEVAHRESRWNPRSTNGNHYGLFQMNNIKVKHLDPYTQIDWWVRYITKRYKGNACLSLAHLKREGWQ